MERAPFIVDERRRHERVTAPAISVMVDGKTYETNNWSLGGLMIEGYEGKLTPGALFTVEMIGAASGSMAPVNVRSRVVRSDPKQRRLMVSFLDVDHNAYAVLQDFMAERMRVLKGHQSV